MPLTPKGQKILGAMEDEYGAKKGKSVFYASANAGKIKGVHHSPDRYDDAQLTSEAPPRHEYHGSPENLNETETPKKAGLSRGKIQQSDGTDSPRSNNRTKSAAMPDSPEGGQQSWPGGVDSFKESSSDRP